EFVEGERLGHRLEHGPLPLADARSIAHQLLDGLDAAHARGVLHLDFKSDNVMLRRGTSPPEAVIMDFGLSRTLDRPSRPPHERHELAGTLPYMSVEQLESDAALGPATDVYSFGVVLYEMLTGRLPFSGNTSSAMLLEQLQRRPPPPSHYAATLSRALDHFVLRCLDNDPSHRFSNAGAALDALETIDDWQRQPEPRARLWCLLAVAAACALVLAAALDLSSQREPTPTVVLQPLEAAPHAPLAPPTPELPKHPPSLPDALAQPAELPPPLAPAHRPARDDATRAATTRHPAPLPLATATALAGASVPPKPPSARFPDSTTARPNPLEAARATNDINDDWTPRALPRSLLVPTRRDTSVR
ncbi:MAG TPA: serine/threonine-protein kinase, partial [Polyangiaceae bacterium]|nr:serine/threonine-protein kinase [Polyangiaceae bacterium]